MDPAARRFAIAVAVAVLVLQIAYGGTLAAGFMAMSTPLSPIPDPWFTLLEVQILLMMPAALGLMVAVHAIAPLEKRVFSAMAVVFMALLAGTTMGVHFLILVLHRQMEFAGQDWYDTVFAFHWPSVAYVLDILGWDVFFALSMLFGAAVFPRRSPVRWAMVTSGLLSFGGLAGVVTGEMGLRNIGIVGYLGVFAVVAALLLRLFLRGTAPEQGQMPQT
jgi:small basic protein